MTLTENRQIRAVACSDCYICGAPGETLYRGLQDRLFDVPGEWGMRRCPNPGCGLIWLDPMPLSEDLGKAYCSYYTHRSSGSTDNALRHFYTQVKMGYIAKNYGYALERYSVLIYLIGWLVYLDPGHRAGWDSSVFCLRARPGGRLLEIGCGNGDALERMRGLGWRVEGVDFDPRAVCNAKEKGLTVRVGNLADQQYSNDTFEAIVMSHLIEHIPDPLNFLRECYRIMRPGGRLVIITPNAVSRGHQLFGRYWRGLEPPRHLFLYSPVSLHKLIAESGLEVLALKTTAHGAASIYVETNVKRADLTAGTLGLGLRARAHLYQFSEGVVNLWRKSCGSELFLEAQKPL